MQSKIVVINHITLDGVYEGPVKNDHVDKNFKHAGWSAPAGADPKMQQRIGKFMAGGWALLAGRNTYEELYQSWAVNQPEHPMAVALTGVHKYVVSHNDGYNLPWQNSTLLAGDAGQTVARLKKEYDKTLVIFGSGVLVQSLMQSGLVDEFLLMIHPVVLASGRKLFNSDAAFAHLQLTDTVTTDVGVIIATYKNKP